MQTLKGFGKGFLHGLAIIAVLPLAGPELIARRIAGRDLWFRFQGQMLSLLPGKFGYFIRGAYYHLTLRKCPLSTCFHFGTIFTQSATEVGERVCTGIGCVIGLATIGDDVLVGEAVHVLSGKLQHYTTDPSIPYQEQGGVLTRILIGKNVWLGAGTMVMDNIGDNCIIGAGSVIHRAIPENMVAMGNPARPIRKVFPEDDPAAMTRAAQAQAIPSLETKEH